MFTEIILINYKRPLAQRLAARKHVGPYRWRPSKPGNGRGFYMVNGGTDSHDSTFRLRIEEANQSLRGTRKAQTLGYYCDLYGDETLTPIIARLPRGRGFLAGWTMGEGMCASLDARIYPDEESAAYAAHSDAESTADNMRDEAQREFEENDDASE